MWDSSEYWFYNFLDFLVMQLIRPVRVAEWPFLPHIVEHLEIHNCSYFKLLYLSEVFFLVGFLTELCLYMFRSLKTWTSQVFESQLWFFNFLLRLKVKKVTWQMTSMWCYLINMEWLEGGKGKAPRLAWFWVFISPKNTWYRTCLQTYTYTYTY